MSTDPLLAAAEAATMALGLDRDDGNGVDSDEEFNRNLDLGVLDLTNVDEEFDEVDENIQANMDDEMVRSALEKGVDLRQYMLEIEEGIHAAEEDSVVAYLHEAEHLCDLHNQIQACDGILANMETILSSFQADLGTISVEIQTLQDQSMSMTQHIKNRKTVQTRLDKFVQELVIPPQLARDISKSSVGDEYLISILDLEEKIKFFSEESTRHSRAAQELMPSLDSMRDHAVQKLRAFILDIIYTLRKPNANYELIQESQLMRYRHFMNFLSRFAPEVAREIRTDHLPRLRLP